VLSVTDEGLGIAPEHIPHLTDPFFTTKRESGGTGLGLSVSATIVKEHNGTLEFTSTPGNGTTVTLTLPVTTRSKK
ncbi:MAG: HAMP domain-containing sensor histidine kinase, partial [Desulfuromonadales bacterium]